MTKKHLLSIPVVFCVFICTMCTDAISPLLQKQKNNRFISLSEAKANVLDLLWTRFNIRIRCGQFGYYQYGPHLDYR